MCPESPGADFTVIAPRKCACSAEPITSTLPSSSSAANIWSAAENLANWIRILSHYKIGCASWKNWLRTRSLSEAMERRADGDATDAADAADATGSRLDCWWWVGRAGAARSTCRVARGPGPPKSKRDHRSRPRGYAVIWRTDFDHRHSEDEGRASSASDPYRGHCKCDSTPSQALSRSRYGLDGHSGRRRPLGH